MNYEIEVMATYSCVGLYVRKCILSEWRDEKKLCNFYEM